ncbi:MAG TPA: DUF6538 domain-containing protein [Mesorhizobium sp.]|jgi:integrase|nr:DUF6538 domain-containing protein [Mesorhizobium sp.]
MAYLKRRGSTYHAQLAVPHDLQAALGRKTVEQSLRTKDRGEAQFRVLDVVKAWHELFQKTRAGGVQPKAQLKELTAGQLARRDYEARLKADTAVRNAVPAYASIGFDDLRVAQLRDAIAGKLDDQGLEDAVEPALKRFARAGFNIAEFGTPQWREQAKALAVAEYEALARVVERDEGEFAGQLSHPVIVNAEPEPEVAPKGEGILDLFDRYARENQKGVSADTLKQARRDVALFAETVGNIPASKITRRHVAAWKDLLLLYPVKAAEIAAFKGLTMQEIAAKNEALGKPRIGARTVNRYLSGLSSFCDWLRGRLILDANPCDGLFQALDKTASEARPFTADELATLFDAPPFTGALSDEEWRKPGNVTIRDHKFWIPLVMLFSGARPNEIAQLRVNDVREQHGHWIMHITTIDEAGKHSKGVKTKGSVRVVPIHPELAKLGFLAYRAEIAATGEKRLFPKATQNTRGQWVADFSRDFNRYLTTLGLKEGRGLSLYSFRHGFMDALREAGFLDEQFRFLVGHTAFTTTALYGRVPEGTLQQRVAMVAAVAYPGLELAQLYPQAPRS